MLKKGRRFGLFCFFYLCFLVVASTELACIQDNKDDDGSLICSFRVVRADVSTSKSESTVVNAKHCMDGVCIEASMSSYLDPSVPQKRAQEQDQLREQEDGVIKVGKATYRPPFSQYGMQVADWLDQVPSSSSSMLGIVSWAQWCGMLGFEHLNSAQDWYGLELAINALEEAISSMSELREDSTNAYLIQGWNEYIASVENNLGEAYSRDPTFSHNDEALEHFENARDLYKDLLVSTQDKNEESTQQIKSSSKLQRELNYAQSLSRVGAHLATMEENYLFSGSNDLFAGGGGGVGGLMETITKITENEGDSKRSKAMEQFDIAIDIFQPNFQRLSNKERSAEEGVEFISLCTAYGSTLQYVATANSNAGDQHQAEFYMVHALEVYMFGEETSAENLNDSNLYSIWVRMGSMDSIVNLLVIMSAVYSQLGMYNDAKLRYGQAMNFYKKFDLAVPEDSTHLDVVESSGTQDLLDQHFALLEAYRHGIVYPEDKDTSISEQETQKKQGAYYTIQEDDGYEGDLMYNLGTIYLTMGKEREAASWFEQAIELYERSSKTAEAKKIPRATAFKNLSSLYLRLQRFDESEQTQNKAFDLYEEMYGEGVNPFVQGLEDYEQNLLKEFGKDSFAGLKNGKEDDSADNVDAIDLDSYKQSIQNLTESALKNPNSKDEL